MAKTKKIKLSDISSILFECKQELKTLGDIAEDLGNERLMNQIDDLYVRVSQMREAIQKE